MTASSAAKILRLNRKTINSYYNEFRKKILGYSLREQEKELGEFELDDFNRSNCNIKEPEKDLVL
jgi:hypothetical protein